MIRKKTFREHSSCSIDLSITQLLLDKDSVWFRIAVDYCPACRTTLIATRFRVAVICPIIQVPHCIRVFFYFVWFVFINHIFQFYYPRPVLAFGYCHRLRLWVCVWVCVCVYQSRACPDDNSSPIQARIAKFGPEMQNTLVWVPIVLGDDRPRSSRSNLTWKSNFTPFWACSHHYSSAIQARITKFGPKMHLSTVKIPTNFWLDWFWSSLSFSIWKPIFLPNLFAPFLYIFSETRRL